MNIDVNLILSYVNLDMIFLFDLGFIESNNFLIDIFISKIGILSIFIIFVIFDLLIVNLIILGFVFVVESYMWEVIWKCVILDFESRIKCEKF